MSQTSRSHYVHVEVGCRESKVRPADRTLASLIFALPWALPGEGRAWVASRKPRVYCLSNPVASFWPRVPVLPDPHLLYPLVVPPPSQMFSGQSIQTQNWCPLGNFCLPPHPLQRAVCSRENNYIWRQIISGQGLGSARPYRGNEVSKPQVMNHGLSRSPSSPAHSSYLYLRLSPHTTSRHLVLFPSLPGITDPLHLSSTLPLAFWLAPYRTFSCKTWKLLIRQGCLNQFLTP